MTTTPHRLIRARRLLSLPMMEIRGQIVDKRGVDKPRQRLDAGSAGRKAGNWAGMIKRILGAAVAAIAGISIFAAAAMAERGPVTNLPLPRYVSLKASEGNVRRGPGMTHRVDWVFTRRDMPLLVTAEFEHWRRVQDAEGAGGWIHFALLSGVRTALVLEDMTPLQLQADPRAPLVAYLEAGVVAEIQQCVIDWCRLRVDRHRGWVLKDALWGVESGEVFG